jgi:hypothetical protein
VLDVGEAGAKPPDRCTDVHYRDLVDVERRIVEAEHDHFAIEHLACHLAGIPTYIVVAELALGQVVSGVLPRPTYPEALKQSASARWQQHAQMTLDYADKTYASRGAVIGVAGSVARAVMEASHGRLAAGGVWVTNEKALVAQAGLGNAARFLEKLEPSADRLHRAIEQIRELIASP